MLNLKTLYRIIKELIKAAVILFLLWQLSVIFLGFAELPQIHQ